MRSETLPTNDPLRVTVLKSTHDDLIIELGQLRRVAAAAHEVEAAIAEDGDVTRAMVRLSRALREVG